MIITSINSKRFETYSECSEEEYSSDEEQLKKQRIEEVTTSTSLMVLQAKADEGVSIETLVKKITDKMLKKIPTIKAKFNAEIFKMQVAMALYGLTELQQQNASFPSFKQEELLTLVASGKNEGYILYNEKQAEGSYKEFYKGVGIKGTKVKGKAELVINDLEEFIKDGLKLDPLDFCSEHVIAKNEFIYQKNNSVLCIKSLYDGNIVAQAYKHKWSFEQRLEAMRQALLGIKDFHDNGYIHRDIKPENIFVKTGLNKTTQKVETHAVIADEDSAIKISNPEEAKRALTHPLFTIGYTPVDSFKAPSCAGDMYAFGRSLEDLFKDVTEKSPNMLTAREASLVKLINQLTSQMPTSRPTAEQALNAMNAILAQK